MVMIFSQYRESVYEIVEILAQHKAIKAMEFVGQSSSGTGGRKSVSQKEQLEVSVRFLKIPKGTRRSQDGSRRSQKVQEDHTFFNDPKMF